MVSTNNKLKRVAYSAGMGIFSGVCSGVLTAAMLAAMGLVAHGTGYVINRNISDYSLKHRFETAYNFNAPESHKYYYVNGGTAEKYAMTPYGMYGIIGAFAGISALLGTMTGNMIAKDKEQEEFIRKQQQKTR